MVEQSRRHAFLASLLGVPHLVLAVNKMDLVDWDEGVYTRIVDDFSAFATKLEITDITAIPMSALLGDNVVDRSPNMAWYEGTPLLYHLEHVHIASDRNLIDARLPVQWVIRPGTDEHHDYRGLAGKLVGGVWRVGRRGPGPALRGHLEGQVAGHSRGPAGGGLPAHVGHGDASRTTSTSRAATCSAARTTTPTSAGTSTRWCAG